MMKGQLAFDFMLSIVMFLVLAGVIMSFVNDFEDKNNLNLDNFMNYDSYLQISDLVLSSQYALDEGFTFERKLYWTNESCEIIINNNVITVGSEDNNFSFEKNIVFEDISGSCKTINLRK